MTTEQIIIICISVAAVVLAVAGFFIGAAYRRKTAERKIGSAEAEAAKIRKDAESEAQRAKKEVKTFDIKEFVKSEKKKKLMEMMNSADGENTGGMMPPPFPMMPPFGEKPSIPRNDIPMPPIMSQANGDKDLLGSDFNVDELVKKIDAKIAELEEEERKNKEAEEKKKEISKMEVIGDKESEIVHKDKIIEKNLDLEDDDDDDEFFDDFFDN